MKKPNAEQLWKHLEDHLVPRLRLNVIERAVYSHLVRHSRLEGRRRLRFSITRLGRATHLSDTPARKGIRSLVAKGVLRLIERSKAGHIVEVLLPEEIRACRRSAVVPASFDLEAADFMGSRELRNAIHQREGGHCFYCLRQLTERVQCLDHVVPRVRLGRNSYRNLVSACVDCNSQKGELPAEDFLRQLYRQGRLNASELAERLRSLTALAAGKLKPVVASSSNALPRKGRPPLNPAHACL